MTDPPIDVPTHLDREAWFLSHPEYVLLSDGSMILTHAAIWAGGLKASSLSSALGIQTGRGGRDVQRDFSVGGVAGVYVLGDFANIAGADGKPLEQLASVALQAGKHCANNIAAAISGEQCRTLPLLRQRHHGDDAVQLKFASPDMSSSAQSPSALGLGFMPWCLLQPVEDRSLHRVGLGLFLAVDMSSGS